MMENPARAQPDDNTAPIRLPCPDESSLFAAAADLARKHAGSGVRTTGRAGRSLKSELSGYFARLRECHAAFLVVAAQEKDLAPAAEWLVDNFAKAEQHFQQVIQDLPRGYSRRLPRLIAGQHQERPRIYGVTWNYLALVDSHFTPESSIGFIRTYQETTPLTIGEVWAFAIHLRALLIENAARISMRTLVSQQARDHGDALLTRLLEDGGGAFDLDKEMHPYPAHARHSFLVHLLRRMRDRRRLAQEHIDVVEKRLLASGYTVEESVAEENARQADNTLIMRSIFKSFTAIAELDWEAWFEQVSLVDRRLGDSIDYPLLDAASKTLYRNAVEDLARHSAEPELSVAGRAVDLGQGESGVSLLGAKRRDLEQAIAYRPTVQRRVRAAFAGRELWAYAGGIVLLALFFAILALNALGDSRLAAGTAILLGALALAPAFEAAMAMINFALMQMVRPAILPGYSFRAGISPDHKAIIAVPALLSSIQETSELLDRLEDHYLSNRDDNLFYALVTDWSDAETETLPGDSRLLAAVANGVDALNRRHGTAQFMLFHRKRRWNAAEDRWMGWERKRGKLDELNLLLRGNRRTSFVEYPANLPGDIAYVIVLDADTQLPPGTARQMVGKLAHPLNKPVYSADKGRVVSGYGIIQPRITISLPKLGRGSFYRRIFAHRPGLDPYVFAISDVYQDVFAEGSFAGKGIYHIDAMLAALEGRFPENSLLSHDLIEGIYARAALATDLQVVEGFPDRYLADQARRHRWIRGDWQLLPWMKPGRPGVTGLGWWKMADNLRRSLLAPAEVAALLAGWALLAPGAATAWTIYLATLMFVPIVLPILSGATLRKEEITAASELRTLADSLGTAVAVVAIKLALLVHRAWDAAGAIVTTLYRLFVSRRHLLEWTTSAQVEQGPVESLAGVLARTWISPALGLLVLAGSVMARAMGEPPPLAALPFAFAWLAAPLVIYLLSRTIDETAAEAELGATEAERLRDVALSTWRFFDAHVNAENNMLPPDNFQETPAPIVANRTSPTNIGLYILSTVSACDMGWIGLDEAAGRIEETLRQCGRLEHYRGHLLNWHDTKSMRPLEPRYISSVDSGNFAAHLIATANALERWSAAPAVTTMRLVGICDCARQVDQAIAALGQLDRRAAQEAAQIRLQLAALVAATRELSKQVELVSMGFLPIAVQINAIGQSCMRMLHRPEGEEGENCRYWVGMLRRAADAMSIEVNRDEASAKALRLRLGEAARQCRDMAYGMDFAFLLNRERQLVSIGYRVGEEALDDVCYDLLASEASLTCYFAIAKGDLDVTLWQKLGRPVTAVGSAACLVSWSGSMFEYLMPNIVLDAPPRTLCNQTNQLIVRKQMQHGKLNDTPWGVSESAFAARDLHQTYQYSNFGVPGLGLKRGLGENLVIAPYATALAAMIDPAAAVDNFARLAGCGGRGRFGFFEAIDFTPERVPAGQRREVVRAFFAHHQGMTITSIHNAVSGGRLRGDFHAENTVRAAQLLLQERAPNHVPSRTVTVTEIPEVFRVHYQEPGFVARLMRPRDMRIPATALYSNGRMSAVIAADGSGRLTWNGVSINRWRNDYLDEPTGMRFMLRRAGEETLHAPLYSRFGRQGDDHQVRFQQDKAEFFWRQGQLECLVEYCIAPDSDAEVRRLNLTNHGGVGVSLELTGFMELALAEAAADAAHPAFSKLFVRTAFDESVQAIIATRRKRLPTDPDIWTAHFLTIEGTAETTETFETDRAAFLGRGNRFDTAAAFAPGARLKGSTGYVLDPCFAFRVDVAIPQRSSARIFVWTVAAATHDEVVALVRRHRSADAWERIRTLAWTHARIGLRHLSIKPDEAGLFQNLSSRLVYSSPDFRPRPEAIAARMTPQSELWPFSISGVRPIVVVCIDNINDLGFVQQILRAQDYWNERGLIADVVILNESRTSYLQNLQAGLDDLAYRARARRATSGSMAEQIFLLRASHISARAVAGLLAAAHMVLPASHGTLRPPRELRRRNRPPPRRAPALATEAAAGHRVAGADLAFFNGFGGFDPETNDYVILHRRAAALPAPWINVIANERFGTHCSAEGGGYTWFGDSKEQQITPWSNDPVRDRPTEMFFVRDLSTGRMSSPTVQPLGPRDARLTTRHGFGATVYEAEENGLRMELTVTVHADEELKVSRLRIVNDGPAASVAVTFVAELAMGASRAASAHFVASQRDEESGALFVHNRFNPLFGDDVIFCGMVGGQDLVTADRSALTSASGVATWPFPSAEFRQETGGGLDPCIGLKKRLKVPAGAAVECVVYLGRAKSHVEARRRIAALAGSPFDAILAAQKARCGEAVGRFAVKTPDPAFDTLMNGWLIYQTLVGRFFARSGFYQASGAYGFRDQLQDSMAVAHVRPDLARRHILRAASRQFVEGDVQHWWLPKTGAGVRTHISDDTAWLAYCTAHYVDLTGDEAILDEPIDFIEGDPVPEGEHDAFYTPQPSERSATLYEHCALALERNLPAGRHGLPLMGTGDWNDGMNAVGAEGRGESVWLGWFVAAALQRFEVIARRRGDRVRAEKWASRVAALAKALNTEAWDGAWYRRAFFDDGTPLGSASSDECRIDAIAQSWAALSGVADPEKARTAFDSAVDQLIDRKAGLALLFRPPFRHHRPNPGYIQSYPPGVRENGGQYTHAALWSVFAAARLGDAERAYEIFSLLNPINHARNEAEAKLYRTEPYVVAADVYGVAPHKGRGGWTWYTGAAGWFYRAGLEAILGLRLEGSRLSFTPCIPAGWPGFLLTMRHRDKAIKIEAGRKAEPPKEARTLKPGETIDLEELEGAAPAIWLQLPDQ